MKDKRGITLIALIITIIVLLILAGVSISMVVGENGILNRATDASEKTKFASEKEAIEFIMNDIKTGRMIEENIPNEKYLGDKLSEMSAVTGDWKNVTVGENTYKDGWYLVEKGKEIEGYGEAKLNWLINYDTGELIELKDGEYTIATANASGAIVDTSLKLNIDPVNLQDPTKWGTGTKFVCGKENDESGVKETEIKFDGVDDYLKIEGVTIPKSEGITFECYGHSTDGMNLLNKTYFEGDELSKQISAFRSGINSDGVICCFGSCDSGSDLIPGPGSERFINFNKVVLPENGEVYISIQIDFSTNEIIVYQNGGLIKQQTTCSEDYLKSGNVFDNEIPFTFGITTGGNPVSFEYSKFDLYACRLYTRVLSDKEIEKNYVATTNYHNELVKP